MYGGPSGGASPCGAIRLPRQGESASRLEPERHRGKNLAAHGFQAERLGEIGEKDIVEVSTSIPTDSEPMWSTWAGESNGPLDLPPGSYRVRTNAYGRDAGHHGELADGAVDRYQLEFWPAPLQPDAIIQSVSDNAEYWHRKVGSRR